MNRRKFLRIAGKATARATVASAATGAVLATKLADGELSSTDIIPWVDETYDRRPRLTLEDYANMSDAEFSRHLKDVQELLSVRHNVQDG